VNKMKSIHLSVDEIVSYLKRTTLPTVLVEGTDDQSIYRYIENTLEDLDADVLVCGGRTALLDIYERRSEFISSQVAYLADKDMWYFTGIPQKYQNGIIFSDGYSIENDLYAKNVFEGLLDRDESVEFGKLLSSLSRWFAFEVIRYKREGHALCDIHINKITTGSELNTEYLRSVNYEEPDSVLVQQILSSYSASLRGKSLFQAVLRYLSATKRKSKYSRFNLIEMGAKLGNVYLDKIQREIETQLNAPQAVIADPSLAALARGG